MTPTIRIFVSGLLLVFVGVLANEYIDFRRDPVVCIDDLAPFYREIGSIKKENSTSAQLRDAADAFPRTRAVFIGTVFNVYKSRYDSDYFATVSIANDSELSRVVNVSRELALMLNRGNRVTFSGVLRYDFNEYSDEIGLEITDTKNLRPVISTVGCSEPRISHAWNIRWQVSEDETVEIDPDGTSHVLP